MSDTWQVGDGVRFDVNAPDGWVIAPVWDPRFAPDEYEWATHCVSQTSYRDGAWRLDKVMLLW